MSATIITSLNFNSFSKTEIFCQLTPSRKFEEIYTLETFNQLCFSILHKKNFVAIYTVPDENGQDEQVWGCSCRDYAILLTLPGAALATPWEIIPLPGNVRHAMMLHEEMKIDKHKLNTNIISKIGQLTWEKLFDFQKECIRFCVVRDGRALIADDMGLGKTIESLAVAAYYKQAWPCLVICTKNCRPGWMNEIVTFLGIDADRIEVIKTGKDLFPSSAKSTKSTKSKSTKKSALVSPVVTLPPLFTIISFALVVNNQAIIEARNYKVIIVDESQYTKNFESKRTQSITAIAKSAKHVLFLSGTPLVKPKEIFPSINALYPDIFPMFFKFGERYCKPETVEVVRGGKKRVFTKYDGRMLTNELHIMLSTVLMIRRLKRDVNIQMPPKIRTHFTLNPDRKQIKMVDKHMAKVDTNKIVVNEDMEQDFGKDNAFMNAYRKICKVKLPLVQRYIQEYVSSIMEKGEKILLFAHHKIMLDGIQEVLEDEKIGYVRLDGKTPKTETSNIVNMFQTDDSCRAALLSMTSAGVGLTLTAGRTILFLELHPSAEIILQAECRAHRIGQKNTVQCIYLIFPKSIEEILWQLTNKKFKSLTSIVDGKLEKFAAKRVIE
jgi:SWI/SNF-related matrix-associated actin-dependent regulator 1 of chromatin subfamily A